MAAPPDLLDPPAVMSYGGLVDASTAEGQTESATDWADALSQMLTAHGDGVPAPAAGAGPSRPARLTDITRRRGAYAAPR